MNDLNVPPEQPVSEPSVWADIAAELHKLADDVLNLVGEPAPAFVQLNMQPGRNGDPDRAGDIDAVAAMLLQKPGETELIGTGVYHRSARGSRGPVNLSIYGQVSPPEDSELARLRAELAREQAENEQLKGKLGSLAYSREPDDPTPVSPARVPAHTADAVSHIDEAGHREDGETPTPVAERELDSQCCFPRLGEAHDPTCWTFR